MTFHFVHAADLHLDSPCEGIRRAPAEVRQVLRDASLAAWDNLVDLAIERDAAFVLLAGDLCDGIAHGLRAQFRLRAGLERLSARGIQVFIAYGDRDPHAGWRAMPEWPEGVTVFAPDEVRAVAVERDGLNVATVYGLSLAGREASPDLPARFPEASGPGVHVAMFHGGVDGERSTGAPCRMDDLLRHGMDYWALGHSHQARVLHRGNPWIVYPGTIQGRGPALDETGAKGLMIVPVEDESVGPPEFVPVDEVRFVRMVVDAREIADLPGLRRELLERADAARAEHGGRALIMTVFLHGSGALHRELARPRALDRLLDEVRSATGRASPILWWNAIRDATQPAVNRDDLLHRADFVAEMLRLKEELAADPDRLRAFAAGRGASRLDGASVVPEPEAAELSDLLDEAETAALDALEGWNKP